MLVLAICLVSDSTQRSLQSADVLTCMVPRNTLQLRWQNFCSRRTPPVELSSSPTMQSGNHLGLFRRQLKGHLFQEAWTLWRSVTSDMRRLRRTLTYLLMYSYYHHHPAAPHHTSPCTHLRPLGSATHLALITWRFRSIMERGNFEGVGRGGQL